MQVLLEGVEDAWRHQRVEQSCVHDQAQTIDEHPRRQLGPDDRETEDQEEGRPPDLNHVIDLRGFFRIYLPEDVTS